MAVYYVTTDALGGDDGSTEVQVGGGVGPWTIAEAFATAAAGDTVWIKNGTSAGAEASYTLTVGQGVVAASGSVANNTTISFKGYKTTIGDMDYGGAYYGGALAALLETSGPKWTILSGLNGAFNLITIDNKDNIHFSNIRFTNVSQTDKTLIRPLNNSLGLRFQNCRFDDAQTMLSGPNGDTLFLDCYVDDDFTGSANTVFINVTSYNVRFVGCVIKLAGTTGIFGYPGEDSLFDHCIILNGHSLTLGISTVGLTVSNCTLYGQDAACLNVIHGASSLVEYNNLLVPKAAADYAVLVSNNAGTVIYSDYSCYWTIAGTAHATPWYDVTNSASIAGSNVLIQDPKFVDAANNDFRLCFDSPCHNAGMPGVDRSRSFTTIGAMGFKVPTQLYRYRRVGLTGLLSGDFGQ